MLSKGLPRVAHYRISVFTRHQNIKDNAAAASAALAGFALGGVRTARLYFVAGQLNSLQLADIARLVHDPLTEEIVIGPVETAAPHIIEVTLHPGVTDTTAESLLRAIQQLNITSVAHTATGQRYEIHEPLTQEQLHALAASAFCNTVIQRYTLDAAIEPPFASAAAGTRQGLIEQIELRGLDDNALMAISRERRLSLDLAEMRAVQAYYTAQQRPANDTELETLAQTWSEHCVHKTFRATIHFSGPDGQQEHIHGLLRTYIRAATEAIAKPWVVSAFVDNAGLIRFDDAYDLAFKVETHNHPSALEPFGGANTGVGGVIRDILGVSARPIANTDILCFGPLDTPDETLLQGVLHPRRIAQGVIAGVEDYGNKMGIPTVNGAVLYDSGYTANPLVFCGCVGILPRGSHRATAQAGDQIVVIGGRTGRDGLRGATFSSMEMDTTTSEIASISVQIGHPINEKQVLEVVLRARDEGLYNAITDCGAGGLSSAVGEMGAALGAHVELASVPLKYPGLAPWEIWLSEAQERMVLAVPPGNLDRMQALCAAHNVEMTVIGTFSGDGELRLTYNSQPAGMLHMAFLHDGIPTRSLQAVWQPPDIAQRRPQAQDYNDILKRLLAHPNIRSREPIVRLYDHEVQGGTVVKPYGGIGEHSPNDGAVVVPLDTSHRPDDAGAVRGFALSSGICPQYGRLDPYAMAWAAVDEACRNLVAVGADPDQIAILDNFCWGNPNLPDRLGSLVLAAKGCHDAAVAYQTPFISGKDSLNNEYADADGTRHAIPGTLLISALGIVPDVRQTVTSDLKQAGDLLFLLGETRPEFGGSHFYAVAGGSGGQAPQPQPGALALMRALHQAIRGGAVSACHDLSEGGLAVAIAEMCIGGGLGAHISLPEGSADEWLFSESTGRFLVTIPPDEEPYFRSLLQGLPCHALGVVAQQPQLLVRSGPQEVIALPVAALAEAWGVPGKDSQANVPVKAARTAAVTAAARASRPRALILHAMGTNRDRDAALACELAGAEPHIVHLNALIAGQDRFDNYQLLILPGGFSYGDDLGAGQLWAQDLRYHFEDALRQFVKAGRPVLGICNGFQALIKAGLLPDASFATGSERRATLTYNASSHFECRWVTLHPGSGSRSLFTEGIQEGIYCPVAHGEGRVFVPDEMTLGALWENGQVALHYTDYDGQLAGYPYNPNGSAWNIAALCNQEGNVMGLMPHPEDHIFPWQHPRYHRGERGQSGLILFENAVRHA